MANSIPESDEADSTPTPQGGLPGYNTYIETLTLRTVTWYTMLPCGIGVSLFKSDPMLSIWDMGDNSSYSVIATL